MGIHHAEGWQKKKVSQVIHEQGQREIKRDAKQANAMIEKFEAARSETGRAVRKMAGALQARTPAKPPARPAGVEQVSARDVQSSAHERVHRHGDEAASNFIQARDKSRGLSELLHRTAEPKVHNRTAVRETVAQKDPGTRVQATAKNPLPQPTAGRTHIPSAVSVQRPVSSVQRRESNDERQTTPRQNSGQASDKRQTTSDVKIPTAIVTGETREPKTESREPKAEKRTDTKKKGRQSKEAGGVYAGKSGASRELGALLDGFGPGGGDTGDGAKTDAGFEIVEGLPERDPDFHVYNADGANPVDDVKSKALVFEKRVEKKLKQIAKLDREVDGVLHDLFETQGLSERIVGEIADELRKELSAARFLYGTVYGGLIG